MAITGQKMLLKSKIGPKIAKKNDKTAVYLPRNSLNSCKKKNFSLFWSRKIYYLRYHPQCPSIAVFTLLCRVLTAHSLTENVSF